MQIHDHTLNAAAAKYRRTYNQLYNAAARANSDAELDAINAKLAKANAEYEAAKAASAERNAPLAAMLAKAGR